jgi:hypothetical protein
VSNNKAARRSFWLIATRAHGRMEVFTIDAGGETLLPVFSFQEESGFFLRLEATEAVWWPREATTGELALRAGGQGGTRSVAGSWEEGDHRARERRPKALRAPPDE